MRHGLGALAGALLIAAVGSPALGATSIALPPRPQRLNVDLMTALDLRKTTRALAPREVSLADLSCLLWAGNGVSRPDGKRTAPSAHGLQYLELYVVSRDAVYRYDAVGNRLVLVQEGRFQDRLSDQPHVGEAPQVLVIVGDLDRLPGPPDAQTRWRWIHATAGAIAQNVALMAAARDIGTGMVGGFDRAQVAEALKLSGSQEPLYLMPVGYLR